MSKFHVYMAKADAAAKEAFSTIQTAEAALRATKEARDRCPWSGGLQDAQTAAKAARLEADYLEAEQAMADVRLKLPDTVLNKLAAIRQDLAAAIDTEYSAKPQDVDPATITLLQSGILTPAEYERLLDDAVEKDNATMARIIGKSAAEAAEKYNRVDPEARALNVIARRAKDSGAAAYLSAYDAVVDVVRRCLRNHAMIKSYDSLVGETVKNF